MNDQSQIEAKIIHLTPPQRFQVAHQLPKDRPGVPTPVCPPLKGVEYKVITTNPSKIWAIRILNGTWLLVTLFLKRCTRIDKNLLVVYVALVLLLLQVFLVISGAEAGSLQSPPLMTRHSNHIADCEHTRSAHTYPNHFISNATLPVQSIERTPVSLPKNPPWQLRLAPTCPGTNIKAAGARLNDAVGQAAAALFAYFFQLQGNLRQSGSLHASENKTITDAKSMTRGSETNIIAVSYPNPPEPSYKQDNLVTVSLMQAYSIQISTLGSTGSETRSSENEDPGSALKVALTRKLAPEFLSGIGVPQMITSFGSLT